MAEITAQICLKNLFYIRLGRGTIDPSTKKIEIIKAIGII